MAGHGKNESFDDWLARKAAKKDKLDSMAGKQFGSGLRRTPLRPISKKQQKRNAEYAKFREEHYKDESNQVCFICGQRANLSVHHISGRGSNTTKEGSAISLCLSGSYLSDIYPELNRAEGCHGFIHRNQNWAREQGYLV
jgi:hypothetical protein